MNNCTIKLPEKGMDKKEILDIMKSYGQGDANYRDSKTWSLVYYIGEEHTQFLKDAYSLYFSENALNPMAFQSLKRFESEVIRMTANLLNGDRNVVGSMTSGGTESCLLPVVTYRDLARSKRRLWITKPEMIAPESIHVAWEKAAHYFDVKMVHAPVGKDYRVDVEAVKKLINRNTIMLLGSAPSYPHGVIDPIEELGAVALENNIPLHIDSCLGGFILPFVEKLGYDIPAFDFRVPGVTSMSADVHKYGYSAKGASTVLYRNMDYMRHQIYVYTDWSGGIYASAGMLGTRPGGAIAAAWASMNALGEDGYLEKTRIVMETTKKIMDGIRSIPELEIVGSPDMSVFAYKSRSKKLNIYAVGDQMEQKGWNIDRLQRPKALHAMVTPLHERVVDEYISDLKKSVEYVRGKPGLASKGNAAMYGMIANVPLRGMIKNEVLKMMEDMYGPERKMPGLASGGPDGEKEPLFMKIAVKALNAIDRFRKED
ncbi:MAG: aspartate aminotransferase family protein [Deltaproteobacteria bacterium]|nr:aspartate aminotransferase family protein [Deltaproteobacteria bacterium]